MQAANYRKFPDMLIYQRELGLISPTPAEVSERELFLIRQSFEAAGTYLRTYAAKLARRWPVVSGRHPKSG